MDAESLQRALEVATQIVGAAALVTAITPTPVDNAVLGVIKTILNVIGANWGGARNEVEPALPKTLDNLRKKIRQRTGHPSGR